MLMKKILMILLTLTLSLALFANGGSEKETTEEQGPVTLQIFSDANTATNAEPMIAAYKEMTGNTVEHLVVPGKAGEVQQKIDISLMSGEKVDLISANAVYHNKLARSEMALRLNDYIDADPEYDAMAVHGDFMDTYHDGGIYGLPNSSTRWAVFYNKKIFDDAGVAYPEAGWTWDDYLEIAVKLTDESKGIKGSYFPKYDNTFHIKANQAGISAYKADGSSNFDDPIFAEGLEFYKNLGVDTHVQESWVEQKLKKLGSFHFLGGKNAMMFISSWYLSPITNQEKYPRDWEIGVAPTPMFSDIEENKNFGSTGFTVVNKNAAHPEAAYDYAKFMAQNRHKYENSFPALVDVPAVELNSMLQNVVDGTSGEITMDDLIAAYLDNGMGFYKEKLGGVIATEYSDYLKQEGELYILGEQTLEETVNNITERADEAIAKAK